METNSEIEIRNQLVAAILPHLGDLEHYGADYLGYRYFKNDGSSFGFTTNDKWYSNKKTDQFFAAQRKHFEKELITLSINKLTYVTRSREYTDNEYMRLLEEIGMSNSVGIYRFSPKKVEHFFFISSSNDPFCRDKIINHLKDLEVLVNRLSPIIDKAFLETQIKPLPEFFLTKEVLTLVFKNDKHLKPCRGIRVLIDGKEKTFTQRECEVLAWLSFGASNRIIADKLNISFRTVENFIASLKYKLDCNRKALVKIANQKELRLIFKIQSTLMEKN